MSKDKEKVNLKSLAGQMSKKVIAGKVTNPNKKARTSFKHSGEKASSYESMMNEAALYVQHQAKSTSDMSISYDDAMDKAEQYLDSAFQQEGGHKGAYKTARNDLVSVIDRLADEIEGHETVKHKKKVGNQVNPYDFDTKVRLAGEYLEAAKQFGIESDTRRPEDLAHEWQQLASTYANIADVVNDSIEYMGPSRRAA